MTQVVRLSELLQALVNKLRFLCLLLVNDSSILLLNAFSNEWPHRVDLKRLVDDFEFATVRELVLAYKEEMVSAVYSYWK